MSNLLAQEFDVSGSLAVVDTVADHLIPMDKFSSLNKLIRIHAKVLMAVNKWKELLKNKVSRTSCLDIKPSSFNFIEAARKQIVIQEQNLKFPDDVDFFRRKQYAQKDIPNLVSQLNIYPDKKNILRIHGKFDRPNSSNVFFPILLPKDSKLTSLIVGDAHIKSGHVRYYGVLKFAEKKLLHPAYIFCSQEIC